LPSSGEGAFLARAVSEGNLCGFAPQNQSISPKSSDCERRALFARSKRDPEFARLFNAYLLSRIIRIEEDLVDQFFNFSQRRLARVLLLLGDINEGSEPECPLKVSQSTLAEMVGTTRARVSKFMNEFKKKDFVRYNGGLQINRKLISAFLQTRPMSVATKA
jgi:CRP/FNR family cyclic AMP-dependent transcriptional regulator